VARRSFAAANAPETGLLAPLDLFSATFLAPRVKHVHHTVPIEFAQAQTALDLARVACALERFRLDHGRHPADLDELSPRYLDRVPGDPCADGPLRYRLAGDGGFALYSVGWNRVDDGGTNATPTDSDPTGFDPKHGDWVWRY
jgi:hypothetical protein